MAINRSLASASWSYGQEETVRRPFEQLKFSLESPLLVCRGGRKLLVPLNLRQNLKPFFFFSSNGSTKGILIVTPNLNDPVDTVRNPSLGNKISISGSKRVGINQPERLLKGQIWILVRIFLVADVQCLIDS